VIVSKVQVGDEANEVLAKLHAFDAFCGKLL
jgi:hypothetical protein